jgi:hypothetical protein
MKFMMTSAMLILTALTISCKSNDTVDSTDVNEAKIFRSIRVEYTGFSDYLRLRIDFRIGGDTGTTVKLVERSKVQVNGGDLALVEDTGVGTYYELTRSNISTLEESYTFQWTKNDGSVVESIVTPNVDTAIDSPAIDATVPRSELLTVQFTPAVSGDEEVEISMLDKCPYEIGRKSANGTAKSGTKAYIQPDDMADLGTGDSGCLYAKRTSNTKIASSDAHGGGSIENNRLSDFHPIIIE